MAEPAPTIDPYLEPYFEPVSEPDVSHLVTEDDEPVESFFQDKQTDLLTEALRVSWEEGRPFLSAGDVAVFMSPNQRPVVPDVLLSVGVEPPEDFHEKNRRSYFVWHFGKVPEVVIEIVSNDKGGEDTSKLVKYQSMRVPYVVVYDPEGHLSGRRLRIFQLSGASYVDKVDRFFPEVGLGLSLWTGTFDGFEAVWLRWVDKDGEMLALGSEERERADQERDRADQERDRADQERERAERLERKLRELGLDPETP